jgi:hypothetical protein
MASHTSDKTRTIDVRKIQNDDDGPLWGPFHLSHIKDLITYKKLSPNCMIYSEEPAEWVPLNEHPIYP